MAQQRALVVEQSPRIAAAIAGVLEHAGHRVATAACGRAAMVHLRTFIPDLLVLDPAAAGAEGAELVARLRGAGVTRVVLSRRAGTTRPEHALVDGSFVKEPFDARELLQLVAGLPRPGVRPARVVPLRAPAAAAPARATRASPAPPRALAAR
jgi:DNA-binding response OmpR family regulator